jgi:quercetin dioxygenase-like cupin family protein
VTSTSPDGRSVLDVREGPPPYRFAAGTVTMDQLWLTTASPPDPARDELAAQNPQTAIQQPPAYGSLFEVCTFEPGFESPMHRTESIDYVVVLSGEVHLEVQDSEAVRLGPGDTVVQLAATHRWSNRGSERSCIAVVLVSTRTDPAAPDGIEIATDATKE